MDEGLPYLIVGSVVEVLACKGNRINDCIARVTLLNHVLLDQLHVAFLWLFGRAYGSWILLLTLVRTCSTVVDTCRFTVHGLNRELIDLLGCFAVDTECFPWKHIRFGLSNARPAPI